MHVEEADLADDGGADEVGVFVHLGANFQAVAAGDALREGVADFLGFGRDARAGAEVVGAVDRNPALGAFQIFEHGAAIDLQVAHQRKLGERLEADGLFEIVDERGASLAGLAIDDHGASAADFFEAVGVVGDRGGFFAVAGEWVLGDVAQADDHVHVRAVTEFVFLPVHGFIGALLAFDADDESFIWHESYSPLKRLKLRSYNHSYVMLYRL